MKTMITKLPAGEIVEIKKLDDGTFEVIQKSFEKEDSVLNEVANYPNIVIPELMFRRIDAENLSKSDKFMKYTPKTEKEKKTKNLILEVIRIGVKNFYRPIMDPTLTEDGKNIFFQKGHMPAVGMSYYAWVNIAKRYNLGRHSRLGTRLEYGAFLGVLMKELVADGLSVSEAWNTVCNDSKELGHWSDSKNDKGTFETTGSRCICGFYDLGNTYKVLRDDDPETGVFWVAGGSFTHYGTQYPIADLSLYTTCNMSTVNAVGWIVLS